jgi:hypothetical protein
VLLIPTFSFPTEHLFGDNAMRVGMIPEETGPLATGGRNVHLVLEHCAARHLIELTVVSSGCPLHARVSTK